jgi:hypothetical protein
MYRMNEKWTAKPAEGKSTPQWKGGGGERERERERERKAF